MKIIIDAMGGDNAPGEIVRGAVEASKDVKSKLVLVGNRLRIEQGLHAAGADTRLFEIVHAEQTITMEDDPMSVVRSKKNSSMAVGLRLLKERGDAFVSAGNTGGGTVRTDLDEDFYVGIETAEAFANKIVGRAFEEDTRKNKELDAFLREANRRLKK